MRRSADTVYLGRGLVRNLVGRLVRRLRRIFESGTRRIRVRRIAVRRIGSGTGCETAAERGRVIHRISFGVRERQAWEALVAFVALLSTAGQSAAIRHRLIWA